MRRPSNTTCRGTGPSGPTTMTGSIRVMGRRRRAAASSSPACVCAFSRTSNSARARSHSSRETILGVAGSVMAFSNALARAEENSFEARFYLAVAFVSFESLVDHRLQNGYVGHLWIARSSRRIAQDIDEHFIGFNGIVMGSNGLLDLLCLSLGEPDRLR